MNNRELAALIDANLEAAFSMIVPIVGDERGGIRRFGSALAIVSGLGPPFYNPVFPRAHLADVEDVRAAVTWSRSRGVEPALILRVEAQALLLDVLAELGLIATEESDPGMALAPIPQPATIPNGPSELDLRVVDDAGSLEDWHAAALSGPSVRRFATLDLARHRDARLMVGYVDGVPVTGGVAIHGPGTVGLYAISTIEAARRRGYGRAITWALINTGREAWNVPVAVLQASALGEPVYRAMGFIEVCRYLVCERPEPAS